MLFLLLLYSKYYFRKKAWIMWWHAMFNTSVPGSAACERLFSLGKDVLVANGTSCLMKNFQRLLMCQQAILPWRLVVAHKC